MTDGVSSGTKQPDQIKYHIPLEHCPTLVTTVSHIMTTAKSKSNQNQNQMKHDPYFVSEAWKRALTHFYCYVFGFKKEEDFKVLDEGFPKTFIDVMLDYWEGFESKEDLLQFGLYIREFYVAFGRIPCEIDFDEFEKQIVLQVLEHYSPK